MTDSESTERSLSLVHQGWQQLHLERPLAAWACWQQSLRLLPGFQPAKEALDRLLLSPQLPLVARTEYRFLACTNPVRRERWNRILAQRDLSEISEAEKAFLQLAEEDPEDFQARLNQALCLAWLGRNPEAICALLQAAEISASQPPLHDLGVQACTLVELLCQGAGAEDYADDRTNTLILKWDDSTEELIATLAKLGPVIQVATRLHTPLSESDSDQWFTGEWLDRPMPCTRSDLALNHLPRLRASLLFRAGTARFSLPSTALAEMQDLERVLQAILGDRFLAVDRLSRPLPVALSDAEIWKIRFPANLDPEIQNQLLREWIETYYETIWINLSRHSLTHENRELLTPMQASDASVHDPLLRIRLEGLIAYREQLSLRPTMLKLYQGYPFDRLRRRMGLPLEDPTLIEDQDISTLSPTEIDDLEFSDLDPTSLIMAYQRVQTANTRARIACILSEKNPKSVLNFDFPRFALSMLEESEDPTAWRMKARASSNSDAAEGAKLDLLDALWLHLHNQEIERDLTETLAAAFQEFDDPGIVPRVCQVLREAGEHETAERLERTAILLATEYNRPWPILDPLPTG